MCKKQLERVIPAEFHQWHSGVKKYTQNCSTCDGTALDPSQFIPSFLLLPVSKIENPKIFNYQIFIWHFSDK